MIHVKIYLVNVTIHVGLMTLVIVIALRPQHQIFHSLRLQPQRLQQQLLSQLHPFLIALMVLLKVGCYTIFSKAFVILTIFFFILRR